MKENETKITIVKSDREQITEFLGAAVGLTLFAYTLNPEPFDRIIETVRERVHGWVYKFSVWEALQAIRSLDETSE